MTDTMPLSDHPADKLQAALNHGWPDPDRDFPPDYLAACTRWFDALSPRARHTAIAAIAAYGRATKSPSRSSRAPCRRRCLRPRADHVRRKGGLGSGSAKECVAPFSPRRQLCPHASSRDRSTGHCRRAQRAPTRMEKAPPGSPECAQAEAPHRSPRCEASHYRRRRSSPAHGTS